MRPAITFALTGILVLTITSHSFATKDAVRITLVQLTVRGKSPDSVIERMPQFFEQAAAQQADLIVFPEYVLGNRITVDHPRVRKFFALARKYKIYAIVDQWAPGDD